MTSVPPEGPSRNAGTPIKPPRPDEGEIRGVEPTFVEFGGFASHVPEDTLISLEKVGGRKAIGSSRL